MRITKLTIENFMRVKLVSIVPDGNSIIISGKNGQGKSSVLNSFFAALQNADSAKTIQRPIRDGEKKASVTVELGDIIVTRTWTGDDKSYLKVESADGSILKSPQTILDSLVGKLSFEPLAFTTMSERDQLQILLEMVKLPKSLSEFENEKKEIYNERTFVNRELKQAEINLNSCEKPISGLPDKEQNAHDILRQMEEARNTNNYNELKRNSLRLSIESANTINKQIIDLEKQITSLKDNLLIHEKDIEDLNKEVSSLEDVDLSRFSTLLSELETVNNNIRAAQKYNELNKNVSKLKKDSQLLTDKLDQIEKDKTDMLSQANMPVKGLSFDTERIYYNGIPFSQCAKSEQLKVSLGILIKSNPKLKIVRFMNGSFNLLDEDNKKTVLDVLDKYDMQSWIEDSFDGSESNGIVIEDGEVKN